MGFQTDDIVPMNQVRASFIELAEQVLHLTLIEEASRGFDDVAAGRTVGVAKLRARYRKGKTLSRG